jgi:hypothetical protein
VKEDPQRKGRALEDDNDEDKIYKPSGPDGRGWGEYRQYTIEELAYRELQQRKQEEEEKHVDNLVDKLEEKKTKMLIDEDERVDILF